MPELELGVHELCGLHTESGLTKLNDLGGVKEICKGVDVDPTVGITSESQDQRRIRYGENRIPDMPMTSYWQYIVICLEDFTLRLLIGCALLSIGIALGFQRDEELSWLEGVAIIGTVVAVCNIQAIQDWTKERSFRKMNAVSNAMKVAVVRDGKRQEISRYEVVVGDIIAIGVGDVLEADGILLQGTDIECDESAMTGEPEDMKKDVEETPFLFSGCAVKNGSGLYLATAVGINSVNGKITALVRGLEVAKRCSVGAEAEDDEKQANSQVDVEEEEDGDKGVLRGKLDDMVSKIAYFAFGSAGISTVVMLVRYVLDNHILESNDWDWKDDPNQILKAIVTGIAIVVVAVPEGLPLAVTLSLSLSMKKMLKDNNLVKHMDATETMGSATTICSDKTGTLTANRMTVVSAYIGGKEFDGGLAKDLTCGKIMGKANVCQELKEMVCANIVATKADGADIEWDTEADRWSQKGNKTDCAMLAFTTDLGVDYKKERTNPERQCVDKSGNTVYGLKMYPFSSIRKRSGQAVPLTNDHNGPCRLFIKGASEIVISLCNEEMMLDGHKVEITPTRRNEIQTEAVEKFAGAAMRTIALAYVDFPSPPDWEEEMSQNESERLTGLQAKTYKAETNLTFLGVMGIIDPLRDGVPRAIEQCNLAGVDVRMVTGDHKATAVAIAKDCGILRRGIDFKDEPGEPLVHPFTVMNGDEFRRRVLRQGAIDQDAFDNVWPHLRVLSRSSPEDKHTLVSGLCESRLCDTQKGQDLGVHPEPQVVAVTGDGTNDAPALRIADVGFAMKITGTRVAQDAADILLMDDNFESVVKACMWGRNVYDSICKFLQFQLTVNVSAVTLSLIGACLIKETPLSVVQMLWVNLIMDSLGALALASELPTDDLLNRKPYGKNKSLISYHMVWNVFGQSVYQLIVLLTLLFAGAGPACTGSCDPETFEWKSGGLLNIPSGIGRAHHAPPTVHYTVIFNSFVFMQLFNWLNARKLHHEVNIMQGLHRNTVFCTIWSICLFVQVFMVEFAALGGGSGENKGFKTQALDTKHWYMSLALGAFSLVWYQFIAILGRSLKPFCTCMQHKQKKHAEEKRPLSPRPVAIADVDVEAANAEEVVPIPAREQPLKLKGVVHGVMWGNRLAKATGDSQEVASGSCISETSNGTSHSGTSGHKMMRNHPRDRKDREVAREYTMGAPSPHRVAGRLCLAPGGVCMHITTPKAADPAETKPSGKELNTPREAHTPREDVWV